jgi:malate synthase
MQQEVDIRAPVADDCAFILSSEAMEFVAALQREFNQRRRELLERRAVRWRELDAGVDPDFLEQTREVREGDWQVADTPADLARRHVEITGPVDAKMMINALNSGADVFMADLEDALSPTWDNVVRGQLNLYQAVRRGLAFESPDGKEYRLGDELATLLVRPRGWHLDETRVTVDGEPLSASLFDFGLYFFHNAAERIARGTGPYFYLPKLESHLEARLWNDVFNFAQDSLGIRRGSVRATVLIETIMAAFEMEEILYELREHSSGLNAGRWDYIFSVIRKFRARDFVLPDRGQVTMTVPFMRAYTELLVKSCHKRGAHAIGGMAAFIPSRRDEAVNARALAGVRADKEREAGDGFDGTWVAHPDLVPVAAEVFTRHLGEAPHQKQRLREEVEVSAGDLVDFAIEGGEVSEQGVRHNINVALQYLGAWLAGAGAVGIYNLMEDTATAEISRAQLWQWLHHAARLADGRTLDEALYRTLHGEEKATLTDHPSGRIEEASELLEQLVLSDDFIEFLTLPAFERLVELNEEV